MLVGVDESRIGVAKFAMDSPGPLKGLAIAAGALMLVGCGRAASPATLVPPEPKTAVIQLFGGFNDNPQLGLRASANVSDPASIRKLVTELNSLPPYPSGTIFCPEDFGSYYTIVLGYANTSETTTTVKVTSTGCQGVYVGGSDQPDAWAAKAPQLFQDLDQILGVTVPDYCTTYNKPSTVCRGW